MSYSAEGWPTGGNAGQEIPEIIVVEQRQRPASPVEANLEKLKEIIAGMKAPFEQAIQDGDGFEPNHAAAIATLDEMHRRVAYLIYSLSIHDPINEAFVQEAIDGYAVLDGAQGQYKQDHTTWEQRGRIAEDALAAGRAAERGEE